MRTIVIPSAILLLALSLLGCAPDADATFSADDAAQRASEVVESDPDGIHFLAGAQGVLRESEGRDNVGRVLKTSKLSGSRERTVANRLGTTFSQPSIRWKRSPEFTEISIPEIPNRYAIWGSTGRDDFGNLYLGISCRGDWKDSASLCRVQPGQNIATHIGDAVANLQRLGMASKTTMQMKIHSKPVQADDGYVYFTSMDEYGEVEDGSRLPFHGSHLWRIPAAPSSLGLGEIAWEHLLALPEGLVATASTGRYVYLLGYYEHILYQFDTETSGVRKIQVGSSGGHVSRNFLVDLQEHVYVPRVTLRGVGDFVVQLIEFDTELKEISSHALDDYGATSGFDSHGIVAFTFLKNGECLFATAKGALYHLQPATEAPSSLERLGWFHPNGESYPSVLCSPDGESMICGLTKKDREYQWVVFDLERWSGEIVPLSSSAKALLRRKSILAYGSNTRDDAGDSIMVGWYQEEDTEQHLPYAARIRWPSL